MNLVIDWESTFIKYFFFALFALFQIKGDAQTTPLNISVSREYEEESLLFILEDLERKYDLNIKYNASLLPVINRSYSFENITLENVLRIILSGTGMSYISDKNTILVVPESLIGDQDNTGPGGNEREQETETPAGNKTADDREYILFGSLVDSVSSAPIASALIFIEDNGKFTTSDELGQFSFRLNAGQFDFQIMCLTHEKLDISLEITQDTSLQIPMKQRAHLIEEVVIQRRAQKFNIREASAGLKLLDQRSIRELSVFMGENDVMKSVLTLAGVNNIGEGSTGFHVRGGSIDQNLILQDGSLVFNPSHILGFYSAFNPDIVREVLLYKGHIPAYYGGRSSSVLDVIIKEPDDQILSGTASLGLISSKASLEIPLIESKTAILASGRVSYASWLLEKADNPDIRDSDARFYDMNMKLVHRFSDRSKILGSFFQSYDKFHFTNEFGYAWRNRILDLQWKHVFSEDKSSTFQISRGDILNEQFEPEGVQAFKLNSGLEYTKIHGYGLIHKSIHTMRFGGEWIDYQSKPEELVPIDSSILFPVTVTKDHSREWALYFHDDMDLSSKISISAGIRFNYFTQTGPGTQFIYSQDIPLSSEEIIDSMSFLSGETMQSYSSIEPRLSVRVSTTDNSSVKFSYDHATQFIHLISNTATPTPIDIWQVSTRYVPPVRAHNFSLGYYLNSRNNNLEFSIESYFRKLKNTVDYKDFANLLLNPQIETEILSGNGRNFGVEFSAEKTSGPVTGRISYSYSRSLRRVVSVAGRPSINNGEWFSSNYDQPHTFKLLLNYQNSKRNSLNLNFIYSSGRPITAPIESYLVQDVLIPHFSGRNEYRIPSYHRLDLSYRLRMNRRSNVRVQSYLTLAIYNIYARKNTFTIFYSQNPNSTIGAKKLSIIGAAIPSINYSMKF